MYSSVTQNQNRLHVSEEIVTNSVDLPTDGPISYKSDADMPKDEIIHGLMEISAMSLPEEPHKYYSSHRTCTKI